MTQVWPGSAYPLGATYDGTGTNFAIFSEVAEKVELCLFDEARQRGAHPTPRDGRLRLARLPPRLHPGQRYGFRVHGPYDPAQGLRCNPNKLLLDPYAKAIDGQIDWDQAVFGYDFETKRAQRRRLRGAHAEVRRRQPVLRLGRRPPAEDALQQDGHLRGPRQGPDDDPPADPRGAARHLRRHRAPGDDRAPHRPRRHRDRAACRCTSSCRTTPCSRRACATTGATTRSASSRRTTSTRSDTARASRCRSSRAMVRALHEAGIEVILDVVYNHTAEGNHLGPTLSFRGIDNRGVLPAGRGRPAVLHGLHGHREHAQRPAPAVAAADHGLAAVLGHRDARRRLPLRPRLHPGPRAARRRPAVGVLRPRPPGPGRQPGQADRRAVGRRRGRLPGRQLPGRCGRSGTASTATPSATSGAARTPRVGEFASRITGSADLYQHSRPPAGRQHQLRHRATTASRSTTSSPTTRSTTRPTARTTTTARATTAAGTAASRARPTTPRSSQLRARQRRNFIATLMLSQGVPMLLHGDELGRTPGRQQQRLLPGQRAHLDRLGRRRRGPARVHQEGHQAPHRPPDVPPSPVLPRPPGAPGPGRPGARHRLADPGRRADDRRGLGRRLREVAGRLPQRRRHPGDRRARRGRHDDHFYLAFNASHEPIEFTLPSDDYAAALDAGPRHRRDARGRAGRGQAGRHGDRAGPLDRRPAPVRPSDRATRTRRRPPRGVPAATYRLQVHAGFRLDDAAEVAGYLADLGRDARVLLAAAALGRGQQPRLRHRRPRAHRRGARRAARASTGSSPRCTSTASGSCSTWCPTTWASTTRRPRRGGGTCCSTGRTARTPRRSTSTGSSAAARSASRSWARRTTSRSSRSWTASCATTTTASRSRPGTGRAATPQEVHARQHYELVDWRRADADLNYRRFFAINTLAGLRVEDPAVFDATHELVAAAGPRRRRRRAADRPPGRPGRPEGLPRPPAPTASGNRWTVVEKILEPGEELPESLARPPGRRATTPSPRSTSVLVDPAGEPAITALDTELAGAAGRLRASWCTTASARSPTGCSARRWPGWCGSSASCPGVDAAQQTEALAELLATLPRLPQLPARRARAPRRDGGRGRASAVPT